MGKMFVGTLRIELHFPQAHSLKGKRQIMKSMVERTRARFNVSVAEIDHHELWQRGCIGIAAVGLSESGLRDLLGRIAGGIRQAHEAEVLDAHISIISEGEE